MVVRLHSASEVYTLGIYIMVPKGKVSQPASGPSSKDAVPTASSGVSGPDLRTTPSHATFIIDPLSFLEQPSEVYERFVKTLQVLSFSFLKEDFSGTFSQIEQLERSITFLDVIMASSLMESHGISTFTVSKLCYPKTAILIPLILDGRSSWILNGSERRLQL